MLGLIYLSEMVLSLEMFHRGLKTNPVRASFSWLLQQRQFGLRQSRGFGSGQVPRFQVLGCWVSILGLCHKRKTKVLVAFFGINTLTQPVWLLFLSFFGGWFLLGWRGDVQHPPRCQPGTPPGVSRNGGACSSNQPRKRTNLFASRDPKWFGGGYLPESFNATKSTDVFLRDTSRIEKAVSAMLSFGHDPPAPDCSIVSAHEGMYGGEHLD